MEDLSKRTELLRARFNKQGFDVDKLVTILKRDQLLPPEHVSAIEHQTTNTAKLNKLLDECVRTNDNTYQKLLTAVEQCVSSSASACVSSMPVFLTPTYSQGSGAPVSESCSPLLNSDSEDDTIQDSIAIDPHSKELPGGYSKLSNIVPAQNFAHSATSNFPVLKDRLTVSDERHNDRQQSSLEIVGNQISSDKCFDLLHFKIQCDGALGELEKLKQQNAEKIGELAREAESFRNKYEKSESQKQQTLEDLHSLKNLNLELLSTKQQLQESLEQLKKQREEDQHKLSDLHQQHSQAVFALSVRGSGTADILTDMYHASLQKYDALQKDYNAMKEDYAELAEQFASARCQLEAMSDLRTQMDELRRERDSTMRDKVAFNQQCTTVIQNLDQKINENRKLRADFDDLQREHKGCSKDHRQLQAKLSHLQKEYNTVVAVKNAAEKEVAQINLERSTLQEELKHMRSKVSQIQVLCDRCNKEKTVAQKEVELLKKQLAASFVSRDNFWHESQSMVEVHAQLEAERRELQRKSQLMEEQRDLARKEQLLAFEQMEIVIQETVEQNQKEKADEIDQVAKETEVLKRQIDKMKHELTDAEQEAIVATKRRDWAFSEIDKTVQERESIRILCDNLRRDRDRAVSELAKALRNSDECEKQKSDAVKELKEIRDKYEAMMERDARRQQLNSVGHNHSRDSAIDADLQEWETETLEIELDQQDGNEIGFVLVGGKENPRFPDDNALYVSHVTKGGPADGKLRVNDLLLKVNNMDTTNVECCQAEQALQKRARALTLVIRRRKVSSTRVWQPMQMLLSCQKEDSLQLERGLFVSAVHPARVIGKDGMLPCFGDRIISINGKPTEKLTVQEATNLLEMSQPAVVSILRQSSPLSSTGSSPTPTSLSVLSPLTENLSPIQSTVMFKSDTMATHSCMWDSTSGDSARSAGGSSKNLRSSGSQTDSLDSPGPSPPKSLRNHDHEKVRHSMPVLDKAKEIVVERIFGSRYKSQDRDGVLDRQYPREVHEKASGKDKDKRRNERNQGTSKDDSDQPETRVVSSVNKTSIKGKDNVLVEFPSSTFSRASPNTDSKSRKREYEADSNSGTWPKSRSGIIMSLTVPSTVTLASPKERPSIKDPFFFKPPPPQSKSSAEDEAGFSVDHNLYHSLHNSGSSSVKYPVSVASVQPLTPLPKSPPHFSVGVMQGPNIGIARPTFPKKWPSQGPPSHHPQKQYPKISHPAPVNSYPQPHARHPPSHVQTGPKSHHFPLYSSSKPGHLDSYPATVHPQRITQKAGVKSHRPTSAPHRVHQNDKHRPSAPSWVHTKGPPSHPYTPKSASADIPLPAPRPASMEMPYPVRFGGVLEDEAKVVPPAGSAICSALPGLSNRSTAQPDSSVSSSCSQHTSRPLMMNPRYSSPPNMFTAVSPELEVEQTIFSPMLPASTVSDLPNSPSPSQQSLMGLDRITPTPSEDFSPPRYIRPSPLGSLTRPLSEFEPRFAGAGGYPRHDKLLERIRIPSSNSVTTKSGSVEIVSDRSSPVSSIFRFDRSGSSKGKQLSPSCSKDDYLYGPRHHETRTITFEKSSEPVGFQIQRGPAGGIFVSAVNDNSLASQAGLVIGDQLLEVCGINMRNATHEHAVTVLRQCGNNLSMKVQYNPEKYMDSTDSSGNVSALPCVTTSPTLSKLSSGDSEQSTPKHHTPQRSKSNSSGDGTYERPHVVHFKRHKGESGPGFTIVGGNAIGIFVHEIESNSSAASVLQRGDMILEYNNVSFQSKIAEHAFLELNKPCSIMRMTVVNCIPKYNKAQNIPGDRFFIRTNFSRTAEGEGELDFRKDDILVVENTLHRGMLGLWLAWAVDDHGNKIRCGSIPSKLRLEDEMALKGSHCESWSVGEGDEQKGARRASGAARRSFFRRRRHQRNNSKDSREGSFSDASNNGESVPILDETVMGYTQVERVECDQTRPVVLLTPLAEPLIRKLISESPDKYKSCEPCVARAMLKDMEQSLAEGRLVDYWKKEDHFECIRVNHIYDICDEKIHCLLNVNPRAIERLHRLKVYPIVIFVHHKGHKQIREIRDSQFLPEKLTSKVAKDSYDRFTQIEQDCAHLFSSVVQGGNLAEMSTHIKTAINAEQKKAIWITVSSF